MTSAARHIVYVSCADDKHIAVLALDARSGSLTPLATVAVPGTDAPSPQSLPMALSPDGTRLNAALRTEPFPLTTYAIDRATGGLTKLATSTLPDSMCYLAADATGRHLLSASYGGAKLAVNPIGPDGIAGPPAQVLATPPKAHSVLIDPANHHVYAASLGGDAILCQQFDDATGRLAEPIHLAATTPPGTGPRHLRLAPGGRTLYMLAEQGGAVFVYTRDPATGALTERQSISLLPDGLFPPVASADLHLTPDGRFLYASERLTHTLTGFAVSPDDGTLTQICRVASEPTPRGFAITPGGKFLLCAGLTSGKLATYAIEPSGVLVRKGAIDVGAGANWIEILALG